MLEWTVTLLYGRFDMEVVPMDRRGACIVPLYKGKGDKCECNNTRFAVYGASALLSLVGKLDGRVLIKTVRPELNVQ